MKTLVHLLRHGEVHNPTGILYGRRPGFHLSELGTTMAQRVADTIGDRDITVIKSSPLERARETAQPLVEATGLPLGIDERIIESWNKFEGERFAGGVGVLRQPSSWKHLWNPMRPSWGEPYKEIAARMMPAIHDARAEAAGHEAVLVSHQLPIWTTRLHVEKRSFLHDPRKRQCTICSLTTLVFDGERIAEIRYSEPAGDLIPVKDRGAPFSAGGSVAPPPGDDLPGGASR